MLKADTYRLYASDTTASQSGLVQSLGECGGDAFKLLLPIVVLLLLQTILLIK